MMSKKLTLLFVLGIASLAQAQIQHVEMRVEGMT
jgi:hypothetical protein